MPEESAERPDYLLDKFTSESEQARAYAEAEKEMNRMREEMERDRNQFAQALENMQSLAEPPAPTPQQYNPEHDPLLVQYQSALDQGDARSLLAINLELQRQMTQQAIQESLREGLKEFSGKLDKSQEVDREVALTLATERVAKKYEDWDELAPQVGSLLQQNSEWIPTQASVEGYEKAISQAARIVAAEKILADNQRQEANRQAKLAAQGLTGDSSRQMTPEQQAVEWDKIKSINLGGYSGILGG